jgi:hypothetical protein
VVVLGALTLSCAYPVTFRPIIRYTNRGPWAMRACVGSGSGPHLVGK